MLTGSSVVHKWAPVHQGYQQELLETPPGLMIRFFKIGSPGRGAGSPPEIFLQCSSGSEGYPDHFYRTEVLHIEQVSIFIPPADVPSHRRAPQTVSPSRGSGGPQPSGFAVPGLRRPGRGSRRVRSAARVLHDILDVRQRQVLARGDHTEESAPCMQAIVPLIAATTWS